MRILIIEDEKEIADGLKAILVKEGYQVDTVYDGISGLDCLLSNIYDLALLDVMLPKINGIDVLKNARREKINIPVILLTAKSQVEDKILGLDNGADDYMTKPFDAGELLARIRARTRIVKNPDANQLSFGNIRLNQATQKLEADINSIRLANKEYQLLEYLLCNAGQILPKDMLIAKVWGFEDETEYNNLEVYISFLRKKLRFVKANVEIKTVKGVGYSLEKRSLT